MSRGVMKMAPTVLAVVMSTDSATSPCAMYVATLLACVEGHSAGASTLGFTAHRRGLSSCGRRHGVGVLSCAHLDQNSEHGFAARPHDLAAVPIASRLHR